MHLYRLPFCQDKCDLFYNLLLLGLDIFQPKKMVKVHCRDNKNIPLSEFNKSFPIPCEHQIPIELVERRWEKIKTFKAPGPDGIPNWLIEKFLAKLATPLATIFNASIV